MEPAQELKMADNILVRTSVGKVTCLLVLVVWAISGSACSATTNTPNSLDPQGPGAASIADLWWVLLGLGSLVYLIVIALLAWSLWYKRHANDKLRQTPKLSLIVGGGVIFPALILLTVFGSTLKVLSELSGERQDGRLLIEVVGHQWWWEVNYPHQQFSTANEIHIPVGEPVQFKLNAADVIHSFWVPQLHGKLDLIPGRTNTLWLEADQAGQFWGLCAEFCGLQHAKMMFVVVAKPRDEFDDWLLNQQASAVSPSQEIAQRGQALFMNSGCSDCHRVRGTPAAGDFGPDLTHFADRLTLGAGIAPNTADFLIEWITNPHSMKEGNLMPATNLSDEELKAMLAYLQSLQ